MDWYPRYYRDYITDTAQLCLAEHGAYALLLDHYYATAQPLPKDLMAAYRICSALTAEEQAAVEVVLTQFFPVNGDGCRHNARADKELERRQAISARRSAAGVKGGQANAKQMPSKRTANANTKNKEQREKENRNKKQTTNLQAGAAFAAWWALYPKKIGRAPAEKAWLKNWHRTDPELATAKLTEQIASEQWTKEDGKYVPNPLTYINQRRWEDEAESYGPTETEHQRTEREAMNL